MTGRKRTSRALGAREVRGPNPVIDVHGGAAVSSDLPPVSSRMNTSYGSPLSTRLRNPRRGQRRDIVSAVSAILTGGDGDDEDDDDHPAAPNPQFEPQLDSPDLGPEPQQDEPEPESDPDPEVSPAPRRSGRSNTTAASASIPPPSRSAKPGQPSQSINSTSREARTESVPTQTPPHIRRRRGGSEEPAAPLSRVPNRGIRHGSEPSAAPTPDSIRTFGQESSIYGVATFPSTPLSQAQSSVTSKPWFAGSRIQPINEEAEEGMATVRHAPLRPVFNPRPTPGPKGNPLLQPASDVYEEEEMPARRPTVQIGRASLRLASQNQQPVASSSGVSTFQGSLPNISRGAPLKLTPSEPSDDSLFGDSDDDRSLQSHSRQGSSSSGAPQNTTTTSQRKGRQKPQSDPETQERLRKEVASYWAKQAARERRWGWLYRRLPRRRDSVQDDEGSENGALRDHPTWTRHFRPTSWVQGIGSLFRRVSAPMLDVIGNYTLYLAWLIGCVAIVVALGAVVMAGRTMFTSSFPSLGIDDVHWYGWKDLSSNLGQFVPFTLARPMSIFADPEAQEHLKQLRKYDYELRKLKQSTKLHDASLAKLENIVPSVVRMTLDINGKPVITQEFYHALRDLMKDDAEIFTMSRGHHGYYHISDENWQAVRDRLKNEPSYQPSNTAQQPLSPRGETAGVAEPSIKTAFENWVKQNNAEVSKILDPVLQGQAFPQKLEKELKVKFEKFIKAQYSKKPSDVVVMKDDFIRHLKAEFVTHRYEIAAETRQLQLQLEQFVKDSLDTANKAPPAGLTRAEVSKLVDGAVRKAIANAPLKAIAEGKIGANWNSDLKHQVNFFSPSGAGATINVGYTTPKFERTARGSFMSKDWKKSQHHKTLPPNEALVRWEDEGECWCGATANDRNGLPLGTTLAVLLGHTIVPQHVVVEHILPGATLDAQARPKAIEVWAYIEELGLRNRVADFSATHFPDTGAYIGRHTYGDGWVKIGQFEYETNDAQNGVHVHKLDSELSAMGAVTDHVIIRAVSNYGAKDHTCFYRVRLYGELRDET